MSSLTVCSYAVDYEQLKNDTSFRNYKDLLYDICYNGDKYCDECAWMGDCGSHSFAVTDINNDGVDELIVSFYSSTIAFQYMAVWTYDRNIGRVKMLDTYGVDTSFYKNGYAKMNWSHNQGASYPLWPYTIISTDPSNDFRVDVQTYTSGESFYTPEFEAMPDADNDGVIYIVEYNNDSNYMPLTYSEYRAFEDKYIPSNMLIELGYDYCIISPFEIEDIEVNYGNDLPVNSSMTGDVDGNNKVTAADARMVLRYSAKLENLTDNQQKVADVDNSGKVTAADARMILRVAAKLDEFDDNKQDVVQPTVPEPDFSKLNDAFIATEFMLFDYRYDDASYVIENLLFNGYYPSGYMFYSDNYSDLHDNYFDNDMDPYNWFPYYYFFDAETVIWICEEIYHVDCNKDMYWSSNSYFYGDKLYVNSGGPTGVEGYFWIVVDSYSVNSEGKYEIYADLYYNSGFDGESDEYSGTYFIVADWQEINSEYYWTFYSVERF